MSTGTFKTTDLAVETPILDAIEDERQAVARAEQEAEQREQFDAAKAEQAREQFDRDFPKLEEAQARVVAAAQAYLDAASEAKALRQECSRSRETLLAAGEDAPALGPVILRDYETRQLLESFQRIALAVGDV